MSRDYQQALHALSQWFASDLGQILLQQENQLLKSFRPMGIELNTIGQYQLEDQGWIRVGLQHSHIIAWAEQLPIASESVEQVLLLHSLDFCASPYQVLREAERILQGEGRLIILGFNPISLWGLRRWWFGQAMPWHANFIPKYRLQDWLSLLNFEVVQMDMRLFRPPWQTLLVHRRLQGWETFGQHFFAWAGGIYAIQAIKKQWPLTPIRPQWRFSRLAWLKPQPAALREK